MSLKITGLSFAPSVSTISSTEKQRYSSKFMNTFRPAGGGGGGGGGGGDVNDVFGIVGFCKL